jgi:hypothetical protein
MPVTIENLSLLGMGCPKSPLEIPLNLTKLTISKVVSLFYLNFYIVIKLYLIICDFPLFSGMYNEYRFVNLHLKQYMVRQFFWLLICIDLKQ